MYQENGNVLITASSRNMNLCMYKSQDRSKFEEISEDVTTIPIGLLMGLYSVTKLLPNQFTHLFIPCKYYTVLLLIRSRLLARTPSLGTFYN